MSTIFGPITEGADRAPKPARDLVNWFDETFEARGENDCLEDEVASLRDELARAQSTQLQAKSSRLQELTSGGIVPAGSKGRSRPGSWAGPPLPGDARRWLDDRNAGIRLNDPVVAADGLAGRIIMTTPNTAQVTLITDSESSVTARVLPAGQGASSSRTSATPPSPARLPRTRQ